MAAFTYEAINAQGGDAFSAYQVPLAILARQQGLGRLIRHRTDRGVLAVLDPGREDDLKELFGPASGGNGAG